MKQVTVISTSPRRGSNSDRLADALIKGAEEAGNKVEKISLIGKNIQFCKGCLACQTTKKCVISDDVSEILPKVLNADVVVWATPVYYYCMSGQMKTLIDRLNPMYSMDYKFRDVYLLSTAAEDEPEVPERTVAALTGWIDCFPESRLAGSVFCGGVTAPGDVSSRDDALDAAYRMGLNI